MTELWQHSDVVNTTPGSGMYDLGTSCKLAPARGQQGIIFLQKCQRFVKV